MDIAQNVNLKQRNNMDIGQWRNAHLVPQSSRDPVTPKTCSLPDFYGISGGESFVWWGLCLCNVDR